MLNTPSQIPNTLQYWFALFVTRHFCHKVSNIWRKISRSQNHVCLLALALEQCPARVDIGSLRSENWNNNLVHSFWEWRMKMPRSRMKSEMKMPRDWDREVKFQNNSREFSRNETLAGYWHIQNIYYTRCLVVEVWFGLESSIVSESVSQQFLFIWWNILV